VHSLLAVSFQCNISVLTLLHSVTLVTLRKTAILYLEHSIANICATCRPYLQMNNQLFHFVNCLKIFYKCMSLKCAITWTSLEYSHCARHSHGYSTALLGILKLINCSWLLIGFLDSSLLKFYHLWQHRFSCSEPTWYLIARTRTNLMNYSMI